MAALSSPGPHLCRRLSISQPVSGLRQKEARVVFLKDIFVPVIPLSKVPTVGTLEPGTQDPSWSN